MDDSLAGVLNCIDTKKSFILEAGAGSGKTWTLIESLKHLTIKHGDFLEKHGKFIVCITYTNVAKKEIINRINNNELVLVLTIHEFLWLIIKSFQTELKEELINYNLATKNPIELLKNKLEGKSIDYKQYGRNFEEGDISHEHVIEFSGKLFEKYPKIFRLVYNKYPYIFIDEYQDTDPITINLIINYLLKGNENKIVIGFFGDSMQKIYNSGIGKIYNASLETITKTTNFRCSIAVIDLLAKIRPSLIQTPSGKNLPGQLFFIHSNSSTNSFSINYQKGLEWLINHNKWDLKKTKILMLTHKNIANFQGYENLLNVYNKITFYRDRLFQIDEIFIKFFCNKVEKIIYNYNQKLYSEFIRLLAIEGFKIKSHNDKSKIKLLIKELEEIRNVNKVKDVYKFVITKQILNKPIAIEDFESEIYGENLTERQMKKREFYEELMNIDYSEIIKLNNFVQEFTPFSTKHGVKGAEFENVLIIIDDASWNQYNFNEVFSGNDNKLARFERTLNLLYVCCSRSKDKLALLCLSPLENTSLERIRDWFGDQCVYDISNISN
ncbi:UvrD-helicase domain-containing protein [Larkinella punicea]|uniref:ATP-dependent helicase n=1 Tax=Larkinella punicea TaxID=2315727 RepID=A0A368JHU7_9BACT|nr:UvrD-helicase domain-containing protein [Larkinella punicea]RCR67122.1 ATP-dependent helicase [Larkinella punicea]